LIVPVMPFLFAPLALLFDSKLWVQYRLVRWTAIALATVSLVFGSIAAFGCDYVSIKHPLELFL
jgi:hypothetical protein